MYQYAVHLTLTKSYVNYISKNKLIKKDFLGIGIRRISWRIEKDSIPAENKKKTVSITWNYTCIPVNIWLPNIPTVILKLNWDWDYCDG